MVKMKKAQAALEYLMNYWWALLIIIIIGVVVWRFLLSGVVTPPSWRPPFELEGVPITSYSIRSNGAASLRVENRREDAITVEHLEVAMEGCTSNPSWSGSQTIPSQGSYVFDLTGTCTLTAGSTITANFTMDYTFQGVRHRAFESITIKVEAA